MVTTLSLKVQAIAVDCEGEIDYRVAIALLNQPWSHHSSAMQHQKFKMPYPQQ
ncbi:MAG: hypothetical protein RM021_023880 [Nostoc sp. EkiNYC01]|nr:hypothetical protein [Nostoc sp. EkiNYC01]